MSNLIATQELGSTVPRQYKSIPRRTLKEKLQYLRELRKLEQCKKPIKSIKELLKGVPHAVVGKR